MNTMKKLWKDPVWSKVISLGIATFLAFAYKVTTTQGFGFLSSTVGVPLWIIPILVSAACVLVAFLLPRKLPPKPTSPPLTVIGDFEIRYEPNRGLGFPLKCYVELRNSSSECLEVTFDNYIPDKVCLEKRLARVLQVRLNEQWCPEPDGVERVSLYPNQHMRTWIAPDEKLFDVVQLKALRGHLGDLEFSINKQKQTIRI